ALSFGAHRLDRQHGNAFTLRVRLLQAVIEALAAQDEDEAVLLHVLDKHLHAGNLDLAHEVADRRRDLGGDSPGATVNDVPLLVEGAEVAPGSDVAGLKVEVDAEGFEDTTPDFIL